MSAPQILSDEEVLGISRKAKADPAVLSDEDVLRLSGESKPTATRQARQPMPRRQISGNLPNFGGDTSPAAIGPQVARANGLPTGSPATAAKPGTPVAKMSNAQVADMFLHPKPDAPLPVAKKGKAGQDPTLAHGNTVFHAPEVSTHKWAGLNIPDSPAEIEAKRAAAFKKLDPASNPKNRKVIPPVIQPDSRRAAMRYLDTKFDGMPGYAAKRGAIEKDLRKYAALPNGQGGASGYNKDTAAMAVLGHGFQIRTKPDFTVDRSQIHPDDMLTDAQARKRGIVYEQYQHENPIPGLQAAEDANVDRTAGKVRELFHAPAKIAGKLLGDTVGTINPDAGDAVGHITEQLAGFVNPGDVALFATDTATHPIQAAEQLTEAIHNVYGSHKLDGTPVTTMDRVDGLIALAATGAGVLHGAGKGVGAEHTPFFSTKTPTLTAFKEKLVTAVDAARAGKWEAKFNPVVEEAINKGVPVEDLAHSLGADGPKIVKAASGGKASAPRKPASPVEPKAETPPAVPEGANSPSSDAIREEAHKPVPVEAPSGPKEPWQVTRLEARKGRGIQMGDTAPPQTEQFKAWDAEHRAAVAKAVEEGKPVPPEVLAEYPDIKPSVAVTASAAPIIPEEDIPATPEGRYNPVTKRIERVETPAEDPQVTGVSKAQRAEEAAKDGRAGPVSNKGLTNAQTHAEGKAWVEAGGDPYHLARSLADQKRPATDAEVGAILEGKRILEQELNDASAKLDGSEEAQAHYEAVKGFIDHYNEDVGKVSSASGSSLQAWKIRTEVETGNLAQVRAEAIKKKGAPLTPEEEARYTQLTSQVSDLQGKLDAAHARIAEQEAAKAVQKATRQATRGAKVETIKIKRAAIIEQINAITKETAGRASDVAGVVYDLGRLAKPVAQLIGTYIDEGITRLPDVVDKIKEVLPGLSDSDAHRLISGYGIETEGPKTRTEAVRTMRELKAQARLIQQINDAIRGIAPDQGTPAAAIDSEVVVGLRKSLNDVMKLQGLRNAPELDPAVRLTKAIQEALDTLENGPDPEPAPKPADTPEITAMRERLASLKKAISDKWEKPEDASLTERKKVATIEKRIAKAEGELQGQYRAIKPKKAVTPEAVEAAQKKLAGVQRAIDLTDEIHGLEEQLRSGKFEEKPKRPAREITDLERQRDAAKAKVKRAIASQKPTTAGEHLRGYARLSALSGLGTFANLAAAVVGKLAVSPFEEIAGPIVKHTVGRLGGLSERAGSELTFSPKAEAAVVGEFFKAQTYKDVAGKLIGGHGEIQDKAEAAGIAHSYPETRNWILKLEQGTHSAVKTFTQRTVFTREWTKALDEAAKAGKDVNSPDVRLDALERAYGAAQQGLLLGDSAATKFASKVMNAPSSDLGRGIVRAIVPIAKIPINLAGQSLEYSFGTPYAFIRHMYEWSKGTMTPESAKAISRAYKRGGVGLALSVWAANISAFNVDEKGHLTINGVSMPTALSHIPWVEPILMGIYYRQAKGSLLSGALRAAEKGAGDVASHTPFVDVPRDIVDAFGEYWDSPDRRLIKMENTAGKILKGILVPQGLQQWATWQDADAGGKRTPHGLAEQIEMGLPETPLGNPSRKDVPGVDALGAKLTDATPHDPINKELMRLGVAVKIAKRPKQDPEKVKASDAYNDLKTEAEKAAYLAEHTQTESEEKFAKRRQALAVYLHSAVKDIMASQDYRDLKTDAERASLLKEQLAQERKDYDPTEGQ